MSKLIASINMTLDGYCDHTAVNADAEIHQHYTDLLNESDVIIHGRITYQLMEYWRPFVDRPTGEKAMDDFATAIDKISKIVYSRTLQGVDWRNTELKSELVKDDILALKQQTSKNILVGSPSMIVQFGNLGLIDEYQLTIHPAVVGAGLPLFKNINGRIALILLRTKTFAGGAVTHYYEPTSGGGPQN